MKLIDIKPDSGKFYLKHPVTLEQITLDDGTEVYWNVVGQDSNEYIAAQKQLLKDLEAKGDDAKNMDRIDYQLEAQKQLAHLVKGWDEQFNESMGGEYSHEYVVEMLTNPDYYWIYTQLDSFVSLRKNFFPN